MNDDIFERFLKTVGIVIGGFFLIYLMILTTQKQPRGIALKIVMATEFMAKGLFYTALGLGTIIFLALLIENYRNEKRIKKENEERLERERHAQLVYLKQEIESLNRRLDEAHREMKTYVVALHEEQARRVESENHLKNRTAKAAVDEALGHFL